MASYMLHHNGLYVCENKIIGTFCVILYSNNKLSFEGVTVNYAINTI